MTEQKADKIKLLLLDVDGVMTDGTILLNDLGEEVKAFDVKDGLGLKLLMSGGIEVALVSGRRSSAVECRARELGIKEIYQGVSDKRSLCRRLMREKGLRRQEVCSMGDDLPDLPMFLESGLSITVADAVKEIREASDIITKNKGGRGAVREACEWILRCQGKWPSLLAAFSGK